MSILRIRDADGNIQEIVAIKGEKGDSYILTDEDKKEIADMVDVSDIDVPLKETKYVENLATDALENGFYVGKPYGEEYGKDYICLTLTAPNNRIFQILFDELYEKNWDEDSLEWIYPYHPSVTVRYIDESDDGNWSESRINFDVKEYLREWADEWLWQFPTYDEIPDLVNEEIDNQKEQLIADVIAALPVYNGEVV